MNKKILKRAAGTIFGLLLIIGSAQILASAQDELKTESSENRAENNWNDNKIIGTWQTVVTPRNCQTGEPVAPAFPGILTFNEGGTLTGTSTAATSVYGVWEKRQGRRNYSFAFLLLRYNPAGTFISTQKVRQTTTISASGDEFTTTGTVEILDTNGTTIGTGCTTSTGVRFE